MPGIVNNAMQPPAQKAPPAQAAPKAAVPPEAQRIVIAAKKIMAQPEIAKQLVEMMKAAGDPATGIARVTIYLMKQIRSKIKGAVPNSKIVVAAMQEVMIDVAKLGAAAKLFTYSPQLVGNAMKIATQLIAQIGKAKAAPVQAPVQQPAATPGAAPVQQPVQAPAAAPGA